jgi:hypothetical protein
MQSPDFTVSGDDRALAGWVADHPGALLAFRPSAASDLARAVGLRAGAGDAGQGTSIVTLDALRLGGGDVAVNLVVPRPTARPASRAGSR